MPKDFLLFSCDVELEKPQSKIYKKYDNLWIYLSFS